MKKLLVLILMLAVPLFAFADFQVGGTALLQLVTPIDQIAGSIEGISVDDFSFGGDVRLSISLFQASGLLLYSPAFETIPASLELYTDAGIALDFVFLRLGLGAGPNFIFFLDQALDPANILGLGGNIKLSCDLMLGDLAVGAYYLMYLESFSEQALQNLADNIAGNIGISVLFKLF